MQEVLDQFPWQRVSYYISTEGISGWINVTEDTVGGVREAVQARRQLRVCNLGEPAFKQIPFSSF